MDYLAKLLEWILYQCYLMCHNYGLAIVFFVLISKLILLPLSIWVQKNSIKMVKIQPDINFLKAKYFGDKDTIAEQQAELFRKEKYNPFASVFPMLVQIILLFGMIAAIRSGMERPDISKVFLGVDLSWIPSENRGILVLSPLFAGISAFVLCIAQNASNVLQAEQSKANKYGMLIFSVGLSLYLGWFVPVGVAIYWISSNLFAVLQLYLLNWAINPKKYVDYTRLEESKRELYALNNLDNSQKKWFGDEISKREKQDYKRFFKVVNKHLVFYSESSGFYKYYRGIIEYLLANSKLTIHYITSDPEDAVFELSKKCNRIRPYYIGEKRLITLMMKMDADMVVMTMPDLEIYHIKRSYIRNDIEYLYMPHGMDSNNLALRTHALDNYDTIFCTGEHQKEELLKLEELYKTRKKRLIEWGYSLLDELCISYENMPHKEHAYPKILIAPSWQSNNIMDSCLEEILTIISNQGYEIIVRPHPQYVRHKKEKVEQLRQRFANQKDIDIQIDFSSDSTVFEADLVVTDWSSIGYEYAFATKHPVLFINTPMKIMNPEYQKIDTVPINIWLRDELGKALNLDELDKMADIVAELLMQKDDYYIKIDNIVEKCLYNRGRSAEVGGKYILDRLQTIIKSANKKSSRNL